MSRDEKVIYVYSGFCDEPPKLMGRLYADIIRGNELFSFEYSKKWINDNDISLMFDPDLKLYEGRQYIPDKPLFGIFADSCPDRWGRLLMKRREAILARDEGRKPKALNESDYLLGVHDETRMGSLRFSLEENGPFLASEKELAAPPWTTLRKLESASIAFESDEAGNEEKWLKQLLVPGSSLGGARPKASVQAPDGSLWIAKFPSKHDEWNSGAWEIVVHDLAEMCGLLVPEAKLETFSSSGSTYLSKRFDRTGLQRIHFASAMALLGKTDGNTDGVSYLDIAAFIKSYGAYPERDLKELWKRVIFNIATSNTDDHLRNHGFLLTKQGWELSPMYDVNPNIYGSTLSLNIDMYDNSVSFELATETAEFYGLKSNEVKKIIADMQKTVRDNLRAATTKYGLSKASVDEMQSAFNV